MPSQCTCAREPGVALKPSFVPLSIDIYSNPCVYGELIQLVRTIFLALRGPSCYTSPGVDEELRASETVTAMFVARKQAGRFFPAPRLPTRDMLNSPPRASTRLRPDVQSETSEPKR